MAEFFQSARRQLGDTPEKRLCVGATCRCCKTTEWIPTNVPGDPPPELAAKQFRAHGWDVGKRRRDDTCPRCKGSKVRPAAPQGWYERLVQTLDGCEPELVIDGFQVVSTARALAIAQGDPAVELLPTQSQDARRLVPLMSRLGFTGPKAIPRGRSSLQGYKRPTTRPDTEMETVDMPATPAAEAPRQPTREDRRKIVDHLDGCYNLDKGRYSGDWSDAKTAEELKVPRAWVSDLREQLYGPEGNEVADLVVKDFDALKARAAELEGDVVRLMEKADGFIRELKAIDGRLAALRR